MDELLPISVQVCTLNEENNIIDCINSIKKNNVLEILIIDGGSTDNTLELLRSLNEPIIKIVLTGRVGLSKQRQMGIENTNLPYLAIVDADDRLTPNCLGQLLNELKSNSYMAIQATVLSRENNTYWQRAYGYYCEDSTNVIGESKMVGRPALYVTESIKNVGFDPYFTYGTEDTHLSIRFEKMNLKQGIGSGVSYRIHARTFKESVKKWRSYGRGYYRITKKYPEKQKNILKQMFWRVPFIRMSNTVKKHGIVYFPYFWLYALFVIYGYLWAVFFDRESIVDTGR